MNGDKKKKAPAKPNGERLYSVSEFAEIMNMSNKTVYQWIRTGKIRSLKIAGSLVRIPQSTIDNLLNCSRGAE